MVDRRSARVRASSFDDIEDWMERRQAEVQQLSQRAAAVGRKAWDQATRNGRELVARTPDEVVALGTRVLKQADDPSAPSGSRPYTADRAANASDLAKIAPEQFLAGARGAQDAFTLGVGDRLYAGARAVGDATRGADLGQAFANRMRIEHARDQYDALHYGIARTTGQAIGTGAQIAALGPAEGLVAGGVRMVEATPLVARELGVLGGVGAGVGVGGQAASDFANRHFSPFGDYAGAGFGGAVGALASLGGHGGYAGAAGGFATSLAQDLFNGRAVSMDRARDAALTGGLLGTVAGAAGRSWSDKLSNQAKEELGEDFSRLRTWARGDKTLEAPKSREYLDGRKYTYPDQRSYNRAGPSEIIESKFGRRAKLRRRQQEAFAQLPNYRVDHGLPKDVGVLFAAPAWAHGAQRSTTR